jgi:nucleoside-diphosphate-sugar epimerase
MGGIMRAVVVGGLGFVGSHLVRRLLDEGHQVAVADCGQSDADELTGPSALSIGASLAHRRNALLLGSRVFGLDVADRGKLSLLIDAIDPHCVYYLAAAPLVAQVEANPPEAGRSMMLGLTYALEIVRARIRPTRFVFISSSMVYGHFATGPICEDAPARPVNLYGALKLAGEVMTQSYLARTPHPSVVVRPSGVYGPTDIHGRVVQKACEAALTGKPFIASNPAETFIDFTWVEDLVAGLVAAGDARGIAGETFNLTFGGARSLDELVAVVSGEAGHLNVVRSLTPSNDRPRRGTLDITRARRLLGYRPSIDLEAGVERYVAFLRAQMAAPAVRVAAL